MRRRGRQRAGLRRRRWRPGSARRGSCESLTRSLVGDPAGHLHASLRPSRPADTGPDLRRLVGPGRRFGGPDAMCRTRYWRSIVNGCTASDMRCAMNLLLAAPMLGRRSMPCGHPHGCHKSARNNNYPHSLPRLPKSRPKPAARFPCSPAATMPPLPSAYEWPYKRPFVAVTLSPQEIEVRPRTPERLWEAVLRSAVACELSISDTDPLCC